MNKHTLYISFDGLSDPLGQSQIVPYLCGLAAEGYQICVLSCEKENALALEEQNIRKRFIDLPISWQYVPYSESGGIISRWLYFKKLYRLADKNRRVIRPVLTHCRSYLAALIGLKLKIKYGIPFIFDMRGFWADERLDGNIWSKKNPLHLSLFRYFKKKEKLFMANADAVISLTKAGSNELCTIYGKKLVLEKTHIIPCCTNTSQFDPQKTKSAAIAGLSENDHLIVYTGSIGTWYYTKEMIDCVLTWKSLIPSIKLLILTKDKEAVANILKSYSSEEKTSIICETASYAEVPSFLKLAKAAIFFIKPAYSKVASSPTKMAECWAMNLPIITNSGIGDNDHYFNFHKGGALINDFSKEEYLLACQNYLALPKNENFYRKIAINYFNFEKGLQAYAAIYKSIQKK